MATILKITPAGIFISKELLAHLSLQEGDSVCLIEIPGGLHISPCDPEFDAKIETAKRIIDKYSDALQKLAE